MSSKVFRDPLYNYVSIDLSKNKWLLGVINSKEIQRLRRIHQLGVSNFTYPGADHNRLCHSLGVLQLMQIALEHFSKSNTQSEFDNAKVVLLAAAITHDVGHGPFSHLFEPCLGIDHEEWSLKIIRDSDTELHQKLKAFDPAFPETVASLIDPKNQDRPSWQKHLISSQLDVDRLDYIRRDSLFTGAGYGHFDWHRLITTMELHGGPSPNDCEIVWNEKAKLAIEEYIFSRFYMYQNVYLHKTTRGFEQMLQAMWRRGRELFDQNESKANIVPVIGSFWRTEKQSTQQFLAIEEFSVLTQIQEWASHSDPGLSYLARNFLNRVPFAMIEEPPLAYQIDKGSNKWEVALKELVEAEGFKPGNMYCLVDKVKSKYHQPYIPEKESDEQSIKNAIRIKVEGGSPVEISKLLPRLRPITEATIIPTRYYIPKEVKSKALELKNRWQNK